jgi:hypothetical protein
VRTRKLDCDIFLMQGAMNELMEAIQSASPQRDSQETKEGTKPVLEGISRSSLKFMQFPNCLF